MRLLYLVSEDHYFCSHRLELALAAQKAGYEVAVATRCHHHEEKIRQAGLRLFPLTHLHRASLSPWKHLRGLWEIIQIYRLFRPHLVHAVALVPLILGTLAALFDPRPALVGALGGLGYVFTQGDNLKSRRLLKRIISSLLRGVFCFPRLHIILQNQDDYHILQEKAGLPSERCSLIPGAGIHLEKYSLLPFPSFPPFQVAFVGRLLWDKGLGDLVAAILLLRERGFLVDLNVYGLPDFHNPACIPLQILHDWRRQKLINWHGYISDMREVYKKNHISVLPSYREGLPKTLLEASACGRPVVATQVPGCQDVVKEGITGLLVPCQSPKKLADALETLFQNPTLWALMGQEGRHYMEEEFSDKKIYKETIQVYNQLLNF